MTATKTSPESVFQDATRWRYGPTGSWDTCKEALKHLGLDKATESIRAKAVSDIVDVVSIYLSMVGEHEGAPRVRQVAERLQKIHRQAKSLRDSINGLDRWTLAILRSGARAPISADHPRNWQYAADNGLPDSEMDTRDKRPTKPLDEYLASKLEGAIVRSRPRSESDWVMRLDALSRLANSCFTTLRTLYGRDSGGRTDIAKLMEGLPRQKLVQSAAEVYERYTGKLAPGSTTGASYEFLVALYRLAHGEDAPEVPNFEEGAKAMGRRNRELKEVRKEIDDLGRRETDLAKLWEGDRLAYFGEPGGLMEVKFAQLEAARREQDLLFGPLESRARKRKPKRRSAG